MATRAMTKAMISFFVPPRLSSPYPSTSPLFSLSFAPRRPFFRLRDSLATTFPGFCSSFPFACAPPIQHASFSAAFASSSTTTPESSDTIASSTGAELGALDLRIGKVLKAWKHPEADSLYVEEVDLGEPEGPRTICSGLVNYVPLEELQDKFVVVLANLKARNMRGVKSNGMLLAASNIAHTEVELLVPPEGSMLGERVWFGMEMDRLSQEPPALPNQLQKKKIWEAIQPELKVNDEGFATFQGKYMRTSAGVVRSKSLRGANIS